MFTGIIETRGIIQSINPNGDNIDFWITSDITAELKVDQSLAHNGVCLTVVEVDDNHYRVTAIPETLNRTNLGKLAVGSAVNLERAMLANSRFDGHIVQGHVDQKGTCTQKEVLDGSWKFGFSFQQNPQALLVEKGSICVDGVSLTVVDAASDFFSVAIIPYTYEHTGFNTIDTGSEVNLEFDIVGKYLMKQITAYQNQVGKMS